MADTVKSIFEKRRQEREERKRKQEEDRRRRVEQREERSRPLVSLTGDTDTKKPPKKPLVSLTGDTDTKPPPKKPTTSTQNPQEEDKPLVSLTGDTDTRPTRPTRPERPDYEEEEKKKRKKEKDEPPRRLYDTSGPSLSDSLTVGYTGPQTGGPTGLDATAPMAGLTPALPDLTSPRQQGAESRQEAIRRGWREMQPQTPLDSIGGIRPLTDLSTSMLSDETAPRQWRGQQGPLGMMDWSGASQVAQSIYDTLPAVGSALQTGARNWLDSQTNMGGQPDPKRNYEGALGVVGYDQSGPGGLMQPLRETAAYDRYQFDTEEREKEFGASTQGVNRAFQTMGQAGSTFLSALPETVNRLWRGDTEGAGEAAMAAMGGAMMLPYGAAQITSPTAAVAKGAGDVMSGLQMVQDWMNTRTLPDGLSVGAAWVGASKVGEALPTVNLLEENLWEALSRSWKEATAPYRAATTFTPEQQQRLTPVEQAQIRDYANLNFGDPASMEQTKNELADRSVAVEQKKQAAQRYKELWEQATTPEDKAKYAVLAADSYAAAYEAENAHPIQIVHKHTNVLSQLYYELFQPDFTDLLGGAFALTGLTPAARRLSKAEKLTQAPASSLSSLAVGPAAKLTDAVPDVSTWDKILQRTFGSTGYSRAELAVRDLTHPTATLLADVDTAGDARLLLTYLARDPEAFRRGLDANLFQSEGLLNRAVDGKIYLDPIADTPQFREALNAYRMVADDYLANSKVLNADGLINKVDLMEEFRDAVRQGGYRRYGVATEFGEAPIGTVKARIRTLADKEAYVEYLDSKGNVIGQSDRMTLKQANNAANELIKSIKQGRTNERSVAKVVGDYMRGVVTPFYILSNPGTWSTNIISAVAMAASDGTYALGKRSGMENVLSRIWGGVMGTKRSQEGIETAASVGREAMGRSPIPAVGKIIDRLGEKYGSLDNMTGIRVEYKSTMRAIDKMLKPVLQNFAQALQAEGISDPRILRTIQNRLHETAREGGDMLMELNKLLAPNVRTFNFSDINPRWLDVIPAGGVSEFRQILDTVTDPAQFQARVNEWADNMRKGWEAQLLESPPPLQRYTWMKEENVSDLADLDQLERLGRKHGADLGDWKKQQAATMTEIEQRQQILTQMVADSKDPNNRYVLYDVWGQIQDRTDMVRAELAQRIEDAYARTAGVNPQQQSAIFREVYFEPARRLWDERNKWATELMENAATQLRTGAQHTPNYDYWRRLERAAGANEQQLWDTMRLEPGSGRYDSRLKQTIEAGRTLADKEVANTFAAARRFNTDDAFDIIISAEKSNQTAGAQVAAYLDNVYQRVADGQLKWEDFFSIRNETWRQFREYEAGVWKWAQRNIVERGLAMERKTGLRFDAGPDGVVELLRPVSERSEYTIRQRPAKGRRAQPEKAESTYQYWYARREDGTFTKLPDNAVPDELKQRYRGLSDEQVATEVQLEMDNIASAEPLAADAQRMVSGQQTATATDAAEPKTYGVWRSDDGDIPVEIVGSSGKNFAGDETYRIRLADGATYDLPQEEIRVLTDNNLLRTMDDISWMEEARRTIDMADPKALEETRKTMRVEWDKKARAALGLPKLDQMIFRFGKGETVVIPDNVKGLKLEDLWGTEIAGYRIENSFDLERFLTQYRNLKKEKDALSQLLSSAQANYVAAWNRGEPIDPKLFEQVRQELNLGSIVNMAEPESAAKMAAKVGDATISPDNIGHMASYANQQIEQIRNFLLKNAEDILRPAGAMSEGGSMRVLSKFRQEVMPQWDRIRNAAAEYSNNMRSFTVLDPINKTRLDELLGLYAPYGFFFTRTIKNQLERQLFQPHIWRRVTQTREAMNDLREQHSDPQRYQDSLRVQVGDQVYYLNFNPEKYWPTYQYMLQNDFANPESANSAFGFAVESMNATGLNGYPIFDIARKIYDGDTQDIYPAGYLGNIGRIAGWALPQVMGHDTPQWTRPAWYEYNIARELENMVASGGSIDGQPLTQEEARMAIDMLRQQRSGEAPLPEQAGLFDPERMQSILNYAAKEASNKNLTSAVTSWATGVGVRPYDLVEGETMEAQGQYFERGFDEETNPYGSREAMAATLDENPALRVRWDKSAIADLDDQRPAQGLVNQMSNAEMAEIREGLYDAGNAAVEALRTTNRDATKQEIYQTRLAAITEAVKQQIGADAVAAYMEQNPEASYADLVNLVVDTVRAEKYPSYQPYQGDGSDPRGTSPEERQQRYTNNVLREANQLPGKPEYPGENAKSSQWKKYYQDLAAYERQQREFVVERLTTGVSDEGVTDMTVSGEPARKPIGAITRGEAVSRWNEYKIRNHTPFELLRHEEIDRERAVTEAEHTARRNAVVQQFGDKAGQIWDAYGDARTNEEKQAFKERNPAIREYNMFAYNTEEYQQLIDTFGEDAWKIYYSPDKPKHPGDEATEEQLEAYYAELDKFNKANPDAYAINLWVNGRRKWSDEEASTLPDSYYDFGKDYEQAVQIFGEDIFEVYQNVPWGADGKTVGQYFERHDPELSGYMAWLNQFKEQPEEYTELPRMGAAPATVDEFPASMLPDDATTATPQPVYEYQNALSPNAYASSPSESMAPSPTSGTTDIGAPQEAMQWGADGPQTALEFALTNENYVEAQARRAAWTARRTTVVTEFGEDAGALWDAYFDLPEGDERKQFRQDNPQFKLYSIAAFYTAEYEQAKEIFGFDNLTAWSEAPRWDGTEERDQERNQYWQKKPDAFLVNAWMNGRPSGDVDRDKDVLEDEWRYNFGADYETAKEMFGDDIWEIVKLQKSLYGDKRARNRFYDQYPQYMDWSEWWYANLPDREQSSTARSGGGGRSWGGGGWGGGGWTPTPRPAFINMPNVRINEMRGHLWASPLDNMRQWRPEQLRMEEVKQAPRRQWR